MIVKRPAGWHVMSENGSRNLGGPYATHEEAVNRLRQVEYYKAHAEPSGGRKRPARRRSR